MTDTHHESGISVDEDNGLVKIGDTAIAVHGYEEGRMEVRDFHDGGSWVEFEADGTRVSLEFGEVQDDGE